MHMTVIHFVPLPTYLFHHDAQAEEYEFDSWHMKRLYYILITNLMH